MLLCMRRVGWLCYKCQLALTLGGEPGHVWGFNFSLAMTEERTMSRRTSYLDADLTRPL